MDGTSYASTRRRGKETAKMSNVFGEGAGSAGDAQVEWEIETFGEEGKRQQIGRGIVLTYDCPGCNVTYQFLIPWGQITRMATLQPIRVDDAEVRCVGNGYHLRKTCRRCLALYDGWSDQQCVAEATTIIDLTPYVPAWIDTMRRLRAPAGT